MKCPRLKSNANMIQSPQMSAHLENMERDECIEDDCKDYKKCWGEDKK